MSWLTRVLIKKGVSSERVESPEVAEARKGMLEQKKELERVKKNAVMVDDLGKYFRDEMSQNGFARLFMQVER